MRQLKWLIAGICVVAACSAPTEEVVVEGPELAQCLPEECGGGGGGGGGGEDPPPPPQSRYVVLMQETEPQAAPSLLAASTVAEYGGTVVKTYAGLRGFVVLTTEEGAEALREDSRVLGVDRVTPISVSFPTGTPVAAPTQQNPGWALDRIDQRSLPLDAQFSVVGSGSGVRVYVLDTGIYKDHVEFGGRVTLGPSFAGNGGTSTDCGYHGTHVAGLIGGALVGVAKQVSIVSLRVFDCSPNTNIEAIVDALDWVVDHGVKPAVVNMSISFDGIISGITTRYPALNAAVQGTIANGFVVVAAAGNNSGADACGFTPGMVAGAITVGATTVSDGRAGFSNQGSCVDMWAPGVDVLSAVPPGWSATGYYAEQGTSMATPLVAGAAALWLANHPTATPLQVRSQLVLKASDLSSSLFYNPNLLYVGSQFGGGDDTQAPVSVPVVTCSTSFTCSLSGAGSTDNTGIKSYRWTVAPAGTILNTSVASYTAPSVGTYTFTLDVEDYFGHIGQASVVRSIGPEGEDTQNPVAVPSVSCPTSYACALSGAGSTDDGGIKKYTWTIMPGGATLNTSVASFTAPSTGTYTFTLKVEDHFGRIGQTSVTRSIGPEGEDSQNPVAVPSVTCPSLTCTLNGAGSTDDGGIQSYTWTINLGNIVINAMSTTQTLPAAGAYTFKLRVVDYFGRAHEATVVRAVTPDGIDHPPTVAIAGGIATLPNPLHPTWPWTWLRSLDVSEVSTDDIGVTSILWKICPNATPTVCVSNTSSHWVTGSVESYLPFTLTLKVTDMSGNQAIATQSYSNNSWPQIMPPPPVFAVITNNSTGSAATGRVLAVSGTASNDYYPVSTYEWKLCPDATPTSCQTATGTTWTVNPVTSYLPVTLTLTVTDTYGRTASANQHFTTADWP